MKERLSRFWIERKDDLLDGSILVFALLFGYLGGYFQGRGVLSTPPVIISTALPSSSQNSATLIKAVNPASPKAGDLTIVASKAGKKYHYASCPGGKAISAKNKITFAGVAAARSAGYTPAANCPGLE